MSTMIKCMLFFVFSIVLFTRCIDEVRLNIDNDRQWLVVDGLVADSLQDYSISVYYSAIIGLGSDNIKTPVTGASVRVLDDAGGVFEFPETSGGQYTRYMQGEVGKTYQVEVKTADGKTILSRPATLQKAPGQFTGTTKAVKETTISPAGATTSSDRVALEVSSDVSGMPERPYLRWRAIGEYEFRENYPTGLGTKICYVPNNVDFNNIKIFDTNELSDGLLTHEPFLTTVFNYRFAFMYCFHMFQYAISKEEYQYWSSVRDIVNLDGSLFDPPPGTVKGNLYNPDDSTERILGYFSVAGVSYNRTFTNAPNLGLYVNPNCNPNARRSQFSECRECDNIPLSTMTRPWYWEP